MVLAILVVVTLLALAAGARFAGNPTGGLLAVSGSQVRDVVSVAPDTPHASGAAVARRPMFSYSVIPGGAYGTHELTRAADRDSVVALHYRRVDLTSLSPEILKEDRFAYVSYRMDDRVYWTQHKVRIGSGETILTNGETAIRGRCGNRISMAPMLPTSDSEPDILQFDAQFDALTDSAPLIPASIDAFVIAPPSLPPGPAGATSPFSDLQQGLRALPLGALPTGVSATRAGSSQGPTHTSSVVSSGAERDNSPPLDGIGGLPAAPPLSSGPPGFPQVDFAFDEGDASSLNRCRLNQ